MVNSSEEAPTLGHGGIGVGSNMMSSTFEVLYVRSEDSHQ